MEGYVSVCCSSYMVVVVGKVGVQYRCNVCDYRVDEAHGVVARGYLPLLNISGLETLFARDCCRALGVASKYVDIPIERRKSWR